MKMCLLHNGLSTLGLVVTHLQTEAVSFRNVVNIVTVGDYSKSPCQCMIDSLQVKLTYLLTPWCRVLLEKLTGLQLVKKLPAFHGIPRFITALTSVRHLSLSWASPIHSIYPHPTSWRSILILSTNTHHTNNQSINHNWILRNASKLN